MKQTGKYLDQSRKTKPQATKQTKEIKLQVERCNNHHYICKRLRRLSPMT